MGTQQLSSHGNTSRLMRTLVLVILAGVVAYSVLLWVSDAASFAEAFKRLTLKALALATALSVSNFAIRFVRWHLYLGRLGVRLPLGESALIFLSGFAMSVTPGKSGELFKALMIRASTDTPVSRTAPVVLAERLTDLAGLVLLGSLGIAFGRGPFWAALLLGTGAVLLGLVASSRKVGSWAVDLACRIRVVTRFRPKLLEVLESFWTLGTPALFILGTLLSLLAWGAHCVALQVAAQDLGAGDLSLAGAVVAYCVPLLAGTLAMIPGGLGVTEASMAGLLIKGSPGLSLAAASAITVAVRLVTFWLAIGLGVLALAAWEWRRRSALQDGTSA